MICTAPSARVFLFVVFFASIAQFASAADSVKETVVPAPHGVTLKVRMEGPYTADVPLQVVCYFRYTEAGVKKMKGAPVELDKHFNGVIGALRERGEFVGNPMETLLIAPPAGSIKAKYLLLIGLGDEADLSLDTLEQIGKTALRTATLLGISRVAFAPLIRDQGNDKIGAGNVEIAVLRGMLLAYDTQLRLQQQHLAGSYTLEEWWVEAGPAFYDETVAGVNKAVAEAKKLIASRNSAPYAVKKN